MAGRPLRDGDYLPACVECCPAEAMYFGDLDDPGSTVARLAESPRAFRLLEELGTKPKVVYLSKGESGGDF
jgi:menaquinone reductase, iron-sulfur cluster-binding subunit